MGILDIWVNRPNNTLKLQKRFQAGDSLVFLKRGGSDRFIYRGLMTVAVIGLMSAFYNLKLVAMGQKQSRRQS